MALEIDGFAVLRSILDERSAFPDISSDINKAARALVIKQLKAKGTTLAGMRRIGACLGNAAFKLIVDRLTDAEAKSLLAKLDRHHPDLKTGTTGWRRRQILDLVAGTEPVLKVGKARATRTKKSAQPQTKAKRPVGNTAMAAVWDGRNIDDEDPDVKPVNKPRAAPRARSSKRTP